ncbi:hypothetical protein MHYP_G00149900 [Metynnis hypsauchen]
MLYAAFCWPLAPLEGRISFGIWPFLQHNGIKGNLFCYTTLQRVRREHLESQSRTLSTPERPSIFIIPFSPPDEQLHGPPRYSTVDHCSPPPAYHELELKPDFIPCDPPPAYSDSTSFTLHELSESSPADTSFSAGPETD